MNDAPFIADNPGPPEKPKKRRGVRPKRFSSAIPVRFLLQPPKRRKLVVGSKEELEATAAANGRNFAAEVRWRCGLARKARKAQQPRG